MKLYKPRAHKQDYGTVQFYSCPFLWDLCGKGKLGCSLWIFHRISWSFLPLKVNLWFMCAERLQVEHWDYYEKPEQNVVCQSTMKCQSFCPFNFWNLNNLVIVKGIPFGVQWRWHLLELVCFPVLVLGYWTGVVGVTCQAIVLESSRAFPGHLCHFLLLVLLTFARLNF